MVIGQNSEVSKKLRAAMKAKLDELGVVVDDELPDYIMVMIANKKDKQHMKNDLNLFLGKQTSNFCDWLFDLFERLNSAKAEPSEVGSSKESQPSSSRERKKSDSDRKKEEQREKEREHEREREREKERTRKAKEREEREHREKEDARIRAEKEKEREREKELLREKEQLEIRERRREHERIKREEHGRRREENRKVTSNRRDRRSRSKTWSDDEKNAPKKSSTSSIVVKPRSPSPEEYIPKVSSKVIVKRKPPTESKTMKGTSSMFLRAITEASASAGYGASLAPAQTSKPKSPVKNRLTRPGNKSIAVSRPRDRDIVVESDDDEASTAVVSKHEADSDDFGPQITVTLKGGKEHIKTLQRTTLKRKADEVRSVDKKRIMAPTGSDSASNSPTMAKWNGHINIDEGITSDDEHFDDDDEEAEIDAMIASTRPRVYSSLDDDVLPPTHQLSRGINYDGYNPTIDQQNDVPIYVPTPIVQKPLNIMQPIQNVPQNESGKISERCHFWPKCRQGDRCQYIHPIKSCTAFPACTFGKRCIYIHPPCRFQSSCTNPNCTYTHGGKVMGQFPKAAPVLPLPSIVEPQMKIEPDVPLTLDPSHPLSSTIPCHFKGQCKRVGCHFKHPKECRYGSACTNSTCYFYHTPSAAVVDPTPAEDNKYKWKPTTHAAV